MKAFRVILAVFMTLVVVVSARYFGPNRSYRVSATDQGVTLSHKAPRGHIGEGPAVLELAASGLNGIEASDLEVALLGQVKGSSDWERLAPARIETDPETSERIIVFEVPHKAPTTRYFYRFEARVKEGEPFRVERDGGDPMMVKFKGHVPAWITIVHVLAMFGGFFLLIWSALYALLPALGKGDAKPAARLGLWAWIVMFVGGIPFGFLMNYYAFDVVWEAFPFGNDVTDNKTQVALILWGIATVGLYRGKGRKSAVFAMVVAVLVLALFLIPHSAQVS
jgi:hypothetical protein